MTRCRPAARTLCTSPPSSRLPVVRPCSPAPTRRWRRSPTTSSNPLSTRSFPTTSGPPGAARSSARSRCRRAPRCSSSATVSICSCHHGPAAVSWSRRTSRRSPSKDPRRSRTGSHRSRWHRCCTPDRPATFPPRRRPSSSPAPSTALPDIATHLAEHGEELAARLLESHRRVRQAAADVVRGLTVTVEPGADVLGVFVYVPPAGGDK